MNLIDAAFAMFVAFYAFRGFHRGFIRESFDLMGFVLGIGLSLRFYKPLGSVFSWIGLPRGTADVLAGSALFLGIVAICVVLGVKVQKRSTAGMTLPIKTGGSIFAAAWSSLFACFLLVVLTVIPSPLKAQQAIHGSLLGRTLLSSNSVLYSVLDDFAKHEARNLLFYLRQYFAQLEAQDQPTETTEEFFKIQPSDDIEMDVVAEKEILALVNKERKSRGLHILAFHEPIQRVARAHSSDMYVRGYFAHINPDGKDPFDRMADGAVTFSYAGENLALAPTIAMVHEGLMNSPKHKENILKPEFTDLGVGVFRGPYGLMVTQNFCAGCGG